jgi:RimJ/RimL family protein N-acetyltransferase
MTTACEPVHGAVDAVQDTGEQPRAGSARRELAQQSLDDVGSVVGEWFAPHGAARLCDGAAVVHKLQVVSPPPLVFPGRLGDDLALLRAPRESDVGPYAAAFRDDPILGRRLGFDGDPDENEARQRFAQMAVAAEGGHALEFAIADPAGDAFWGSMLVHSINRRHRRAEVGFWVAPAQRGRGVGTRAVALTVDWLFGDLGLARVEMTTTPENPVIPSLARRLGFRHEGTLRARNVERDRRVDILFFGVLREEWTRLPRG